MEHSLPKIPAIREEQWEFREGREVFCLFLVERSVTESKLLPLAAQQANKSGDEVLGPIVTLFRKPADRGDGGLVLQRTILPEVEFRLLLY